MVSKKWYTRSMKKPLILLVVLVVAIIAIVFLVSALKKNQSAPAPVIMKTSLETLKTFPVFSSPLTNVQNIGFGNFSPDGKFFAYSTFTPVGNPPNQGHVVDLKTGTDKVLHGMLSRGFRADNYLTVFRNTSGTFLYNADTGSEVKIPVGENTFDLFVSPNGKFVAASGEGMVIVNLETNEKMVLDAKPESAGFAWFSDNNRILGFKQNDENLFEAGKGRDLGIWNVTTGEFTKIPISFPVKSIRYVEWLKPDHVARVNAGYDDGSYEYLVNLDTNTMIDLGETSWALMGGITTDQKLGLIAAIGSGGAGDCKHRECNGFIADATGKITEFKLPRDHHRSGLQIISQTKLFYINRDLGEEGGYGTTYVVIYDIPTKTETVLQEVPNMNLVPLALSPDKKVWIVGAGDHFIVGEVK